MRPTFRADAVAKLCLLLLGICALAAPQGCRAQVSDASAPRGGSGSLPVVVRVDADSGRGTLEPIWRFFGADEPNYGYMKDGRQLLAELGALRPGEVYFRTHNLLTSGDGTPALKWGSTNVYTEDARGRPIYDWTIVDRIFDTYRARGVRPYVEIGFMPEALSTHPQPYQHDWRPGSGQLFTGWAYPPKDYGKWGELVYRWVRHCIQRYGRSEVERWYWEVWNEANIPYWQGTPAEFLRLHDVAIAAVRRALPTARVGGPDMAGAGGTFLADFLNHELRGAGDVPGEAAGVRHPLDFIAFHAKGAPRFVDGHVRMGIAEQLRTMDQGFGIVAGIPEAKQLPIIIGESDPDGCAACRGAQYDYRNGTLYASYTAATLGHAYDLAERHGVRLEGALTWAFEFEDQPYFPGFRVLADNGIDHPVLNVFRLFSRMPQRRLAVHSSGAQPLDGILAGGVRAAPDVSALAARDSSRVAVLVWHYHDDNVPGPDAEVELVVRGLPAGAHTVAVTHERIDADHGNAFAAWQRMGSPIAPTDAQRAQLLSAAAHLQLTAPARVPVADGSVTLRFTLPRQAVSLVVLDWR